MKKLFTILSLILFANLSSLSFAQEEVEMKSEHSCFSYDVGADIVSRYVWRGIEFGGSPAVPQFQPYLSLNFMASESSLFQVGAWGSYGFSGDYNENDLFVRYQHSFNYLSAAVAVTDYYYPFAGLSFSNFEGDGAGAHTVEASLSILGNEKLPLSFTVSTNIHNDVPENSSVYMELGYSPVIGEFPLTFFVGAAKGKSVWYEIETDKFEIINLGLSVAKILKISENLQIPVTATWIMNSYAKSTFLVLKLSI